MCRQLVMGRGDVTRGYRIRPWAFPPLRCAQGQAATVSSKTRLSGRGKDVPRPDVACWRQRVYRRLEKTMKHTLTLLAALLLAPPGICAAEHKPNVLFIIADDLNRSLPCYGQGIVKAPNVDRLAARGVRFDRAYCQYPVCSPSRVSFLSGRRPEQTQMFDNEGASRTHSLRYAVFLPEYFRQQGSSMTAGVNTTCFRRAANWAAAVQWTSRPSKPPHLRLQ